MGYHSMPLSLQYKPQSNTTQHHHTTHTNLKQIKSTQHTLIEPKCMQPYHGPCNIVTLQALILANFFIKNIYLLIYLKF